MAILEINQLNKRIESHDVLNGLDMEVPEHSIFGFVGQNGAGKTTTMKNALGLLKADSGSVSIYGEKVVYWDWMEWYMRNQLQTYLLLCLHCCSHSKSQRS